MWDKIRKHVGRYCAFRLDGIIISGFFCGIGEVNGNYGMIFVCAKHRNNEIELTSCLVVHPLKIKCTLYSDLLSLRKTCRKLFRKHKYANHSKDIYYSSFDIKEITNEKGIKAKG